MTRLRASGIRAVPAGVVAGLCLVLVGCVGSYANPSDAGAPDRSLEQAKVEYWSVENDLMAFVPADRIEKDYGSSKTAAVLLECAGQDLYTWPGGHTVVLKSGTDGRAILERILVDWSGKPGWSVEDQMDDSEAPGFILRAADQRYYSVYFYTNGSRKFNISGFSACFHLDSYDSSPSKRY